MPFDLNPMGYGMAGPTMMAHGSPEVIAELLRPLYVCDEIWCQLFSEPGAGSDLAGLATRAVRDGDTWIVSGQKVWTSLAHRARRALLLARTDPQQPEHPTQQHKSEAADHAQGSCHASMRPAQRRAR